MPTKPLSNERPRADQNRGDYLRQGGILYGGPIRSAGLAGTVLGAAIGGRIGGRLGGRGDDPAPYNYGYTTANPYAQKYGGTVGQAIQENPNLSRAELEQLVIQQEEAAARKAQEDQINAYFNDPVRLARYQKEYDAELAAAKNTLGDQTQAGMRSAAQAAASRGIMGGSADIEQRAGLAGQYQSTLSDLAQRRTQAGQAQQQQDVQDKTSLLGLVNSADPFGSQATQSRISGLAGQGRAAQGWINAGLKRDLADQTGANLQSQAFGTGLSGLAQGLQTFQNRRYRQGNTSIFGGY